MTYKKTEIDLAMDHLLKACGLHGESGTEKLFHMLKTAIKELDGTIEGSHEEGLCYNMNAAIADKLKEYCEAC